MTTFRIADTEMDESPPTIAYSLIVLLSAIYACDIEAYDEYLVITDSKSGAILAKLEIDPAFGPLMVAILRTTSEELSGTQWTNPYED